MDDKEKLKKSLKFALISFLIIVSILFLVSMFSPIYLLTMRLDSVLNESFVFEGKYYILYQRTKDFDNFKAPQFKISKQIQKKYLPNLFIYKFEDNNLTILERFSLDNPVYTLCTENLVYLISRDKIILFDGKQFEYNENKLPELYSELFLYEDHPAYIIYENKNFKVFILKDKEWVLKKNVTFLNSEKYLCEDDRYIKKRLIPGMQILVNKNNEIFISYYPLDEKDYYVKNTHVLLHKDKIILFSMKRDKRGLLKRKLTISELKNDSNITLIKEIIISQFEDIRLWDFKVFNYNDPANFEICFCSKSGNLKLLTYSNGQFIKLNKSDFKYNEVQKILLILGATSFYWIHFFILIIFHIIIAKYKPKIVELNGNEYKVPGLLKRALSKYVDIIICFVFLIGFGFLWSLIQQISIDLEWLSVLFGFIGLFSGPLFIVFLEGLTGRSPGKLLFGLRVVDINLKKPGFNRALIRNVSFCVDVFLWLFVIDCYRIGMTDDWLRLGDNVARTIVIENKID